MSDAVSPQNAPYAVECEAGKPIFGAPVVRALTNPSAMDRIRGLSSRPWLWQGDSRKVYFCGCKKTENMPLCDGSHNR